MAYIQQIRPAFISWRFEFMSGTRGNALADTDWPITSIRFEDLVCNPEATARSLAHALGLPFESGMLHATASNLLLPEYQRATFDPDAAVPKPLDAEGMRLIADRMSMAGYA